MRSYERVIEKETRRPQVGRRRKLIDFCALWVGAVIINVLTHCLISAVAQDFQNNTTPFHKAQRAWGNTQVAGACPAPLLGSMPAACTSLPRP